MGSIFLSGAVIVSPEPSSIQHLFPMLHIHQTSARRVVSDQHIVPLVIIQRGVRITDVLQRISAYFWIVRAEDDPQVRLEPLQTGQELMDSAQFEPFHHCLVVQQVDHLGAGMLDEHHRSEAEVIIQQSLDDGVALAEGDMHLHRALAVAQVADLLLGGLIDVGEDCGEVVVCHVLEGELPKLLVFVGVELGVVARVFVASAVAQPYVVPLVCQHEARRLALVVDQPGVGAVDQTMLQDDGLESLPYRAALALDSEHGQDVAVLGGHLVSLGRVVEVLAVVQELELCLGMRAQGQGKREGEDQQSGLDRHWIFGDQGQSCNNGPSNTATLLPLPTSSQLQRLPITFVVGLFQLGYRLR